MLKDLQKNSGYLRKTSFLLNNRNVTISVILFIAFFILFSNVARGFFSPSMLTVILLTGAELGTLTIGITLLLISGEIDLSVASVFVFSDYVVLILSSFGIPLPICFIFALVYGAFAGYLNGFLTMKFSIPSFVVTLGTLIFWRSAVAGLTNGEPTYYTGGDSVLLRILGGQIGIFPNQFLWLLVFVVIFSVILNHSQFGNHILATGGNKEVARALGVDTYKIKRLCFMISSTLASFAGISYLARSSYLDPIVATGMEFEAIAATVIGGTLLSGGSGTIVGATICAFLLKEIQIGAGTYGIKAEYYKVAVGILLVISAIINNLITRKIFKA